MTGQVVYDLRPLLAGLRSGMSAAEVGRWLGVSRERVRQIWVRETGEASVPRRRLTRDINTIRVRKFWASVAVLESGCWEWTGVRYPTGYGQPPFTGEGHQAGYVHRVSYRWLVGAIPDGLTIDHLCRNRACVNPDHLEAVSQRVNTLRSPIAVAAINARKTHCIHGHPFSSENTYLRRQSNGHWSRACRTCGRERNTQLRRAAVA